ncbi:MAG: hypothetical protein HY909_04565 [Deltaproteobacteria bacterium]|nr:hypothetical protein [Deltaproteobacteria bacterium]
MDLQGTWQGPELTAEFIIAAGRVTGVFVLGGQRLPVEGTRQGDALVGAFEAEGERFPFVARSEGGALVVESEGVVFRLGRVAPARVNPFKAARDARPSPEPAPAPPPEVASEGTEYRHPTGGSMRLPKGWQVTQTPMGLQLIPPDPAFGPQGPLEVYLVAAQPAPGVTRADDPKVVAFIDASLRRLVPTLGAPSAPVAVGPGARITWAGQSPLNGGSALAVALLRVAEGAVAGVLALGERPRVEARLPALEAIFGSFAKREGRRDSALVGTWHYWSFRASNSNFSGASTSSETRRTRHLGPDGTVVDRSTHEGVGSFKGKDGVGDTTWTAGYAAQDHGGREGTWTAGDGVLYIQWSDGATAAWQYQLQGAPGARTLLLLVPGEKPLEWTERPVVL